MPRTSGRPRLSEHAFIWPAVLVVLALALFPLVYSLATSFQSVRLVPPAPPRFIGFGNYADLLRDQRFWSALKTTLTIVFASTALQYTLGFGVALALFYKVPGERLFRVAFLLPMLMAPVAVALVMRMIFNTGVGPLADALGFIGLPNPPFLTNATLALTVLVLVEVWQWTPFVILLMLAGLQTLPKEVFEAADIEGASFWQQFRGIIFPMMAPVSAAVIFIRIVEEFKVLDTVYVLTGGGPGTTTETLNLYAYQEGFKKFNLGQTSALSFLFLIIVIIVGVLYLAVVRPYIQRTQS